jgi:hypothetical protein
MKNFKFLICILLISFAIVNTFAFILPQFERNITLSDEMEIEDEREELMERIKAEIREMFYFGYENYLNHAYPLDELKPISCGGENEYGGFSLTLIDAVDTLAVLGDKEEFVRIGRKEIFFFFY